MGLRNWFLTKHNVTLPALKSWIGLSLLNDVIEYPAIIGSRRDMTTLSATSARLYRHLLCLFIKRVDCSGIVTAQTTQLCMAEPLVAEYSGFPLAPFHQSYIVFDAHSSGQLGIKIDMRRSIHF